MNETSSLATSPPEVSADPDPLSDSDSATTGDAARTVSPEPEPSGGEPDPGDLEPGGRDTSSETTTPEPDTITPEPEPIAPEPEETTPVSEVLIAKPEETTPEPEETTPEPETTTPEPEETTPEPETTAPEQGETTPGPDTITPVSDVIIAEPEETTPEPEETTAEPDTTTPEPEATNPEPEATNPEPAAINPEPEAATPEPGTTGASTKRQTRAAAIRATKESLIAQAELVAMVSPPSRAPAEMKALLEQWKQAGRISRSEDNALWARFSRAQDQLFTRLALLREQRATAAAEARRAKESLIATAEDLATRADTKQAAETMASLMSEWKSVGPCPDDKQLWTRFKAAQDTVYARRTADRRQAEADQRQAAEAKRALIAAAQALVGAPDLREATAELRRLADEFRATGYAGREPNRKLAEQFRAAQQEFYGWIRGEPTRRRESGEQAGYGRRARLVGQIAATREELARAEATLKTTDAAGAKRSRGGAITLTLGEAGAYSATAAEAMRLKVRLADLEEQLYRLDANLRGPRAAAD